MRLTFRKNHWKSRHRFAVEDLRYIFNNSSSMKANDSKWKENCVEYWRETTTGTSSSSIKLFDDVVIPIDDTAWKATPVVEALYHESALAAFIQASDVHCFCCNEEILEYDDGVVALYDEEYVKAEALCNGCYRKMIVLVRSNPVNTEPKDILLYKDTEFLIKFVDAISKIKNTFK